MARRKQGRRRLTDAQIKTTFGNSLNASEKIFGRLLLLEARLAALEAAFVVSEVRRGANREKLMNDLEQTARVLSTEKLVRIGDTAPQTAESLDIQGLLSKLLDDLK